MAATLVRVCWLLVVIGLAWLWIEHLPDRYRLVGLSVKTGVSLSDVLPGASDAVFGVTQERQVQVSGLTSDNQVLASSTGFLVSGSLLLGVAGQIIHLSAVEDEVHISYGDGRYWRFTQGRLLDVHDQPLPGCRQLALLDWFEAWQPKFSIGGELECAKRLSLPGSVRLNVVRVGEHFYMQANQPQQVFIAQQANWESLADQPREVSRLRVGRSQFGVASSEGGVYLTALKNRPFVELPAVTASANIEPINPYELLSYIALFACSLWVLSNHISLQILMPLAVLGVINQLSTGLTAADDAMLTGTLSLIWRFALAVLLFKLFMAITRRFRMTTKVFSRAALALAVAIAFALIVQMVLGGELGVGGINPLEASKLMLAIVLTLGLRQLAFVENSYLRKALLINLLLVLAVVAFSTSVSLVLHDYSSLSINSFLFAAYCIAVSYFLKKKQLAHFRLIGILLFATIMIFIALMAWLVDELRQHLTLGEFELPAADRLKSFFLNAGAADSEQQYQAQFLLSQTDWLPHQLSLEISRFAAIESDYALSAFVARAGWIMAALWCACMVAFAVYSLALSVCLTKKLLNVSFRCEYAKREQLLLLSLVGYFLGVALLLHVLLSLLVNLQLIPVMGVPMLFISVGQSHPLLFGFPALIVISMLEKYNAILKVD
jgi:cell division protein FtsW (lipid II flippase)